MIVGACTQFSSIFVDVYLRLIFVSLDSKDALFLTLVPGTNISNSYRSRFAIFILWIHSLFFGKLSPTVSHTVFKLPLIDLLCLRIFVCSYTMHETMLPLALILKSRFEPPLPFAMRLLVLICSALELGDLTLNIFGLLHLKVLFL